MASFSNPSLVLASISPPPALAAPLVLLLVVVLPPSPPILLLPASTPPPPPPPGNGVGGVFQNTCPWAAIVGPVVPPAVEGVVALVVVLLVAASPLHLRLVAGRLGRGGHLASLVTAGMAAGSVSDDKTVGDGEEEDDEEEPEDPSLLRSDSFLFFCSPGKITGGGRGGVLA